jgi:hypothetical protein
MVKRTENEVREFADFEAIRLLVHRSGEHTFDRAAVARLLRQQWFKIKEKTPWCVGTQILPSLMILEWEDTAEAVTAIAEAAGGPVACEWTFYRREEVLTCVSG